MDHTQSSLYWYMQGAKVIASLPCLILVAAFAGFCGFAVESGLSWFQIVVMIPLVWALPAKMILISSMTSGASLLATFLAVSLSSIRMMPMMASLIPEVRTSKTPTWLLLALSHFIAITGWVYVMEKIDKVPRPHRLAFFAGVCITLTLSVTVFSAIIFNFVAELPTLLLGALFFLTPTYFLYSIWSSARDNSTYFAMVFGLILGPIFARLIPELDILIAGILGGTLGTAMYLLINKLTAKVEHE